MDLERQNPHWEKDFYYSYEKKRFIFDKLQKSVQTGLITGLYGLRRIGKSVLLKQLINEFIKNKTERTEIFYYSFDESEEDFWEVINNYEKVFGKKISKNTYLLFDEVQKVSEWKAKIKKLYDSTGARIIVSGSNSSMLRKGGESLAGRINEFFISELSFKEFLYFSNKQELYVSQFDDRLELSFYEYIQKPFPELVFNSNITPKDYVSTIVRKIIYEDLPQVFPIDEPQLMYKLFSILCANPGMLVDYNSLASDLGRNRKTISLYFDYLTYGFLIRKLFNFSKNMLTSEKKLKKFYPTLACFVDSEQSKVIETAVAQTLKTKFFWNHKNTYEVDFVISSPLLAFEVKYKEEVAKKEKIGIEHFKKSFSQAKTFIITKNLQKPNLFVPFYRLEEFLENMGIITVINSENMLL